MEHPASTWREIAYSYKADARRWRAIALLLAGVLAGVTIVEVARLVA